MSRPMDAISPPPPNLDPTAGEIRICPQPGPQEMFAATPADIAIYGGAAGGGKSFGLLFEPLRHIENPDFGAVIFRRTYPEITNEGALWDESQRLYPWVGGVSKVGDLSWTFESGATVSFAHMQREADVMKWHSSQIPLIEFDELTTFTERQFVYMLSRNRSTCGVRPYVRVGTNPDAASWVARWVEWYIDPTTGYPIPERAGKIRWFIRDGQTLRWANSVAELEREYPDKAQFAKSFTFIPAKLEDNRVLMAKDPGYQANIEAQERVERERLGRGNWLVSSAQGEWPQEYFGRHLWFDLWPNDHERTLCTIAWDPSKGTDASWGDYSAMTVLVRDRAGRLWADALMGHWNVEEGIDQLIDWYRVWRPDGVAIEVNQFQQLIIVLLKKRCKELGIPLLPVYEIDNRVNKLVRIRRIGQYLHHRSLRLKAESTGARILSEQLMTFPNGEHDDGPDSLEMADRLMIDLSYER